LTADADRTALDELEQEQLDAQQAEQDLSVDPEYKEAKPGIEQLDFERGELLDDEVDPDEYVDIHVPFPPPPEADDEWTGGPLPYQVEFVLNQAGIKLALWGVGTGKTAVGLFHLLLSSLAYPGMRSLVIAPTYTMLSDTILPMLEEVSQLWAEINGFRLIATFKRTQLVVRLFNGSTIIFRSAERPHRLRGPTVGFIWLDETSTMPNEADVYEISLSRMRGRGPRQLIVTTTPQGDTGIVGQIVEEHHKGTEGYWYSRKTSLDNPYLPADFVPRMRATYSKEFFEQEVLARVLKISGLVYPEFDRDLHLVDWDPAVELRRGNWIIVAGLDWGYAHAHVLYAAVRNNPELVLPEVVIFDEFGLDNKSDEALIGECVKRLNQWPKAPRGFCPDPENPEANVELIRALRKSKTGIRVLREFSRKERRITRSVELIRRALQTADGQVSLKFARRLLTLPENDKGGMGTIVSLEHYRRKRNPAQRGFIDQPYDDNVHTHAMDCARYIYLNLRRLGFRIRLPQRGIRTAAGG